MAASSSSPNLLPLSLLFLVSSSTFAAACHTCGCNPMPCQPYPPATDYYCPRDTLKLAVCANVLGLVDVTVGNPITSPCCALLSGLADLEAAACLCTAIKANVLGLNLEVPVALSVLLSACQKTVPPGFQCK